MPSWGEVLEKIKYNTSANPLDLLRRQYLRTMYEYTGRNVIAYYSCFLSNPRANVSIDDGDKNAFMQAIHGLDTSKGLDIILHTPGGNFAATESIVYYLRTMFGKDIRAFVPQIAMSAGTMIALSCKEIVMGKQSNIGPIDPQFNGISCAGVIEEFNKAMRDIKRNPERVPIWQVIVSRYHPTFIGDCKKAIEWAERTVTEWLSSNMLSGNPNPKKEAVRIVRELGSHKKTFSHSKHIHFDECNSMGIKVVHLEGLDTRKIGGCEDLQDCVLTIHHTYMHTFSKSTAVKIVENHMGNAMITTLKVSK